jgi:NACalpha-BTF3-like transcription factor
VIHATVYAYSCIIVKDKEPMIKLLKEDVDLITHELEIPRREAEKLLAAHNGDVSKALRAWVFGNVSLT